MAYFGRKVYFDNLSWLWKRYPKSYLIKLEGGCLVSYGQETKREKVSIWQDGTRLQNLRSVEVGALKICSILGKALVAKILWRILFGNGMWHEVIIKKYLKRVSLNGWLRKGNSNVKGMSNCWKSLYDSLSIVTDC